MIVEIVVAILVAWAVLHIGKSVLYHYFYDPIGRARQIIDSRMDELERKETNRAL
jgi:hypothetical protein